MIAAKLIKGISGGNPRKLSQHWNYHKKYKGVGGGINKEISTEISIKKFLKQLRNRFSKELPNLFVQKLRNEFSKKYLNYYWNNSPLEINPEIVFSVFLLWKLPHFFPLFLQDFLPGILPQIFFRFFSEIFLEILPGGSFCVSVQVFLVIFRMFFTRHLFFSGIITEISPKDID